MFLFFIIMAFSMSTAAEVCLAQGRLLVPIVMMTGFYFTVTHSWHRSAIPFLASCIMLDLAFGRHFPFTWLMAPAIMLMASYWRTHGNTEETLVQTIPGLLTGLASFIACSAYSAYSFFALGQRIAIFDPVNLLFYSLGGALCFPVYAKILDSIAYKLGLGRFSAAGSDRMLKEEED